MPLDIFTDIVKVKNDGRGHVTYYITIPKQIVQKLGLKEGTLVTIVIAVEKTPQQKTQN